MSFILLFPNNRDTVRSILAVYANDFWHSLWPDVLKANQADACNGETILKLWTKTRRKLSLDYCWINSKVSKDSSSNYALNRGKSRLNLPAVKSRSIVCQMDADAAHHAGREPGFRDLESDGQLRETHVGRPSEQRARRKEELRGLLDRPRTAAKLREAEDLYDRYAELALENMA